MNELDIVEWVRSRTRIHSAVVSGVGDDMAELRTAGSGVLLSSDLLLDSVHFDSNVHSLFRIGRKAVARTLSDCAAMAVNPTALLISLALPHKIESDGVRELFEGMFAMADEFDVAVTGGDTARWNGLLAIDISVLAEPFPGIKPIRRGGARIGDEVYVTGKIGGSILGKHLDFTPRIREAKAIANKLGENLHALMDISDGLALDLWRMCKVSGVGAVLDEDRIAHVISESAQVCSRHDGRSALEHALADGEDYELLMAVSPQTQVGALDLRAVGTIAVDGFQIRRLDGRIETLRPEGWVH